MQTGVNIVGVTGTRGKSTGTHMIYHCLIRPSSTAKLTTGHSAHRNIFLGGNVRGISTLALLPEVQSGDIAVLELDSWQLQGFGDLKISPHISILTNLMPDHQDYYPDMESYFLDKTNIFNNQKKGDNLFVGESVFEKVQMASAGWRTPIKAVVPPMIPTDWKLQIIGEHNRENASFAAAALRTLGLSEAEIKSGIESFPGLDGRLQFVGTVNEVEVYNDNSATTPEATIAALCAVGDSLQKASGAHNRRG